MLVIALILLFLVNKVPSMISGIITGASLGAIGGAGSFGAGAAMGCYDGGQQAATLLAEAVANMFLLVYDRYAVEYFAADWHMDSVTRTANIYVGKTLIYGKA